MTTQLQTTLDSQGTWSSTANLLKARYEGARKLCFILSIVAALLAAVASQLPDSNTDTRLGSLRLWLAVGSAVLLALVSLFTIRFVTGKNDAWGRARSASEALKRIAWTYAGAAAPYDNPSTREEQLKTDRQKIEDGVDDLSGVQAGPSAHGAASASPQPSQATTRADYVRLRAEWQQKWYLDHAVKSSREARILRRYEFALALVATVLTALIGVSGKTPLPIVKNLSVDLVALTGVITTVSGAIVAYIEASRLDFLVTSYRAAARQLKELLAAVPEESATSDMWSAYVQKAENVVATENGAWMAKLGKARD